MAIPPYKYAGTRADHAAVHPGLMRATFAQSEANNTPLVVDIDGVHYRLTGTSRQPLDQHYLIPHYEREGSRVERKEDMLRARVDRFFGSARKNLNVARSCRQMDRELGDFIAAYGRVQQGAEFSLSLPYKDMTSEELRLVTRGSMLVGHIVNRLGRCGRIILHGGDTRGEGTMEPIEELIARWSDHPEADLARIRHKPERDALRRELLIKDFQYWAEVLDPEYPQRKETLFAYEEKGERKTFPRSELMRCAITRNIQPDHDGALSYLIYEIRKILADDVMIDKHEKRAEADPEHVPHFTARKERQLRDQHEARTVDGIVTTIGFTCHAIDETYAALQQVVEHPKFRQFIKTIQPAPEDMDGACRNTNEYRGMLRHFADIARRRCSISSHDAEQFDPIALEFTHLKDELSWLHNTMRTKLERCSTREVDRAAMFDALKLLDRGIDLIDTMAEQRIPRDHMAPGIYDANLAQFKGRDASSVGRLKEKIEAWQSPGRQRG